VIYVHVPFCKSFCTYCDFYSEVKDSFNEYAEALLSEIDRRKDEISENIASYPEADTLYIGGGTPSVLPLNVLSEIAGKLRSVRPDAIPWKEFTVEVNPEDIVEKGSEYVAGLLGLGVTRVSMGIQSFDDGILRWMNRRHDSAGAVKAYEILRGADEEWRKVHPEARPLQISIDVIFGISQLSDDVWSSTIDKALSLGGTEGRPDHISAYQLSIEEGSALAGLVAQGRYSEASDEQCRAQYDILCQKLRVAGYIHYEISNFALPGREALHNSHYWDRTPYVGLGPGAHSFRVFPDGRQVRSWNEQKLPCGAASTYSYNSETLTQEDIRVEELMLGLRTRKGIEAEKLYSLADKSVINRLLREGGMEVDAGRVRISEDHMFTSDEIIRELA
jgi:oxygen-independent coproporphyrinogen-3 oxidase